MTDRTLVERCRTLRLIGALAGMSIALGACNTTGGEVVTASVPNDYRQRHPIAVTEAERSIVVFVGHARGSLTAPQRADVLGLARTWRSTRPMRAPLRHRSAKSGACWRRAACRRTPSRSVPIIRTIRACCRRSS
jgi:pilus biogenesis lipoprotein CpaD